MPKRRLLVNALAVIVLGSCLMGSPCARISTRISARGSACQLGQEFAVPGSGCRGASEPGLPRRGDGQDQERQTA